MAARKKKATKKPKKSKKTKATRKAKPQKPKRKAKSKKDSQLGLFAGATKKNEEKKVKKEKKYAPPDLKAESQAEEVSPPVELKPPPKSKRPRGKRSQTAAERMAKQQREISISEFFTKNRHLLGFDNPQKALLTTVKEAVDNSLDACEEAKILPELDVRIKNTGENRYLVTIIDNGPGIVHNQVRKIFGKLLYGSKFHTLKQSRGQQGIGISAAGMYSQLTTGKATVITSRTREDRPAHRLEVKVDTRKNVPEVLGDNVVEWQEPFPTGTKVELEIEAVYRGGKRSVDQYIEQTAIANPHCKITYCNPKGDKVEYPRLSEELPRAAVEIKPHPHGVELGALMSMLKETRGRDLKGALQRDFSRVSERVALEIAEKAELSPKSRPKRMAPEQVEALHKAMSQVKIMNPPTNCVVPIGEELLRAGLEKDIQADFFTSVSRSPAVYRGNPFQVEAGIAWGGNLSSDDLCSLVRLANRVPLQYQQSDCAITKAVVDTDWRNYKVSQSRGALPSGPMVIVVHMASVWVPFTSESKEAVARYPEILKEIRLALQICGRRLSHHLSARRKEAEEGRKFSYIETYIPHIGIALREILDLNEKQEQRVVKKLKGTLERSRKFS